MKLESINLCKCDLDPVDQYFIPFGMVKYQSQKSYRWMEREKPKDLMYLSNNNKIKGEKASSTYLNSDHISTAEPGGKNFRQDRTREVVASKCRCLNLQPSGPVFL